MQENKKNIIYASSIVALTVILGVLWFFIIQSTNQTSELTGGMSGASSNTSAAYSAAKDITASEDVDGGEFASTNADENAISASGNITANLSNISVTKTGDSDGGDNTSFYGTNSAIIARNGVLS